MGRNPLALLDGDVILHQSIAVNAVDFDGDQVVDLEEAKKSFKSIVKAWTLDAKAIDHLVILSDSKNFRKSLMPSYKAARGPKPSGFKELKEWVLEDSIRCVVYPNLEADDVIGIFLTTPKENSIAVSIDKDLKTVPGRHYNPSKGEFTVVNEEEANLTWMRQVLMGDAIDGYTGIPKIGPKKAQALLHTPAPLPVLWRVVLDAYERANLDPKYAVATARLAYILRHGDYDYETGEVLWRDIEPVGREDLPPEYRRDVSTSRRSTSRRPVEPDGGGGD